MLYNTPTVSYVLQSKFQFDEDNELLKRVVISIFCQSLRQQRHMLKMKYYTSTIVNNIATSPVPQMTDDQWGDLLKHWSDPKNVVSYLRLRPDHMPDSCLHKCLTSLVLQIIAQKTRRAALNDFYQAVQDLVA